MNEFKSYKDFKVQVLEGHSITFKAIFLNSFENIETKYEIYELEHGNFMFVEIFKKGDASNLMFNNERARIEDLLKSKVLAHHDV